MLFLICGHGAGDPGACGNGYSEAERVRTLASRIKDIGGEEVVVGDMNKNWYRSGMVNNYYIPKGAKVLELHMDSAGASARGGHVIIDANLSADKYDKALADFIGGILPGRSKTIVSRNDLANLNRAQANGINYRLLECGFISNSTDVSIFNSRMDDIARGILNAFEIDARASYGEGVSTKRDMSPGSAHLYCDAPIYDREWKNVIVNGKEGDHITILDHGSSAVLVRHNSTEGIMECKYVMPDIYEGDELELVEDVTITLPKGTKLTSLDGGYLGNRVSASFVVESKYLQKIEK